MSKNNKNTILVVGSVFVVATTLIWFVMSVYLTLMLAGANDTLDEKSTVPLLLTVYWTIALFPLSLFDWEKPMPFVSDHTAGQFVFVLIFINSALWGILWYFLFRRVIRYFI